MTKFVTPNNLIAFPSHKGNGFASPRKETTDTTPNNSAEQPKPVTTTDTFLKTTLEKPISTATNTPAEVATAQQALAPLANLPTPVSQLMAGTAGNGMAPQIYVINAGGTPAPPPTIDMEVDTTTPSPLNNGGLLGMNPTTSVSLHEGVGGHHAEEHHGGGGKFNWFNGFFPFPVGGGEGGFPWWEQFSGGAVLGAVSVAMLNLIGLAYQDEYLGPLHNSLREHMKKLEGALWGFGTLLSTPINVVLDIFNVKGVVRTTFDEESKRRYKIISKPSDGIPAYAEISNIGGLPAKVGITGGYSNFASVVERKGETNTTWNWLANNPLGKVVTGYQNVESQVCVRYPDLEHQGRESIVWLTGDIEQPRLVEICENINNNPNVKKLYQFHEAEQKYALAAVEMLANGADKKTSKVNIEFIWDETQRLYRTEFAKNASIANLSQDKQTTLEQLKNSGLKALHEIAPLASELLGGKGKKQTKNAMQHFLDDILFKYLPGRAMLLGAFIGGVLAVKAGYYEAGHKHLNINEEEPERPLYDPRRLAKEARSFIPF